MRWGCSVARARAEVHVPEPEQHDVRSVAESIARLRTEYLSAAGGRAPSVGVGWDFDGFRVWLDSNEPELLRAVTEYFVDFRRLDADTLEAARAGGELTRITALQADPPDFGGYRTMTIGEYKQSVKGPKEAFFDVIDGRVVHKLRTGMWFLFGRDEHLAIGPCIDNPNQIINFVNNRMIQWSLHRGALLGHASAVCRVEPGSPESPGSGDLPRAIAIAGLSGMGKSTLSLHMLQDRRLDFLSNDRVMMRPTSAGHVEIEGVPKHPRINPGTILNNPALVGLLAPDEQARLRALPPDELWQLEHKHDGLIGTFFPEQRFFLRARMVGLVLLNWTRGGGETIARRIQLPAPSELRMQGDLRAQTDSSNRAANLLIALLKQPGVFYLGERGQTKPHRISSYVEYLAGVEVLELAGGIDFDAGRRAALKLLGLD
jgi:HprK-related kinase B